MSNFYAVFFSGFCAGTLVAALLGLQWIQAGWQYWLRANERQKEWSASMKEAAAAYKRASASLKKSNINNERANERMDLAESRIAEAAEMYRNAQEIWDRIRDANPDDAIKYVLSDTPSGMH